MNVLGDQTTSSPHRSTLPFAQDPSGKVRLCGTEDFLHILHPKSADVLCSMEHIFHEEGGFVEHTGTSS